MSTCQQIRGDVVCGNPVTSVWYPLNVSRMHSRGVCNGCYMLLHLQNAVQLLEPNPSELYDSADYTHPCEYENEDGHQCGEDTQYPGFKFCPVHHNHIRMRSVVVKAVLSVVR